MKTILVLLLCSVTIFSFAANCEVVSIQPGPPVIYSATITSGTDVLSATGTLSVISISLCPEAKTRGWFARIGDCFKCLAGK